MKELALSLACFALTPFHSALAQHTAQDTIPVQIHAIPAGGPFTPRGSTVLYENFTNHAHLGFSAWSSNFPCNGIVGDDFTLSSASGQVAPFTLNAFGFAVLTPGSPLPLTYEPISIRLSIYTTHTGWQMGAFPGGMSLLGQVNMDLPTSAALGHLFYNPPGWVQNVFPNGQTITLPDDSGFAMMEVYHYQTYFYHSTVRFATRYTSSGVLAGPGSSDRQFWQDCNYNYLVDTGEVMPLSANIDRGMYLVLSGDGSCASPPPMTDGIPDNPIDGESISDTLQNFGTPVRWYGFEVRDDVTDASERYLDIEGFFDYEGIALALYQGNSGPDCGKLVAADLNTSGNAYAQLTFGIGRRAGPNGRRDFDGRHGELTRGKYFLAVAAEGSTFANGYQVNPGIFQAGTYTVNFHSNMHNGVLTPSDVPDTTNAPLLATVGCLTGIGDVPLPAFSAVSNDLAWYKFTVPSIASGSSNYLDITFALQSALQPSINADVFDSTGTLVSTVTNVGEAFSPGPFWGGNTLRYYTVNGEQHLYGTGPSLPAGEYFMAVSNSPSTPLPNYNRFHVRSGTSNTPTLVFPVLHYSNTGSCLPLMCDSIDFNNDGVSPDSADIDDFLSVYGGGPCSTGNCGDIDFNNDGVSPDSEDIDAFSRVFSGGAC